MKRNTGLVISDKASISILICTMLTSPHSLRYADYSPCFCFIYPITRKQMRQGKDAALYRLLLQLLCQQLIDNLRVSLSFGRLHTLANQKARNIFACFMVFYGLGIFRQHLLHNR